MGLQRQFLWGGTGSVKKPIVMKNWKTFEMPRKLRGLGVGNLLVKNISLC